MSPGMASVPRVRPRRSVRAIWLSTSARVWVRSPEALGGRLVRRGVQLVSARGTEQTMRPNGASVELGEAVMSSATYKDAPTESIDVRGTRFAYRRLGAETGAQVIVQEDSQLVRKPVLAGTGPAGGEGMDKVTPITIRAMVKGGLTFKDPKYYLFFTRTPNGRTAAREFLKRLKERTDNRDKRISPISFRAQLKAIDAWATQQPSDLSNIQHPVLVANGDQDVMVPSSNSVDLARRLPKARLELYPDAGHGGIFQHHEDFVPKVLDFLES